MSYTNHLQKIRIVLQKPSSANLYSKFVVYSNVYYKVPSFL